MALINPCSISNRALDDILKDKCTHQHIRFAINHKYEMFFILILSQFKVDAETSPHTSSRTKWGSKRRIEKDVAASTANTYKCCITPPWWGNRGFQLFHILSLFSGWYLWRMRTLWFEIIWIWEKNKTKLKRAWWPGRFFFPPPNQKQTFFF
jgi:hypothetical protein